MGRRECLPARKPSHDCCSPGASPRRASTLFSLSRRPMFRMIETPDELVYDGEERRLIVLSRSRSESGTYWWLLRALVSWPREFAMGVVRSREHRDVRV
jgi:hypothetical protein